MKMKKMFALWLAVLLVLPLLLSGCDVLQTLEDRVGDLLGTSSDTSTTTDTTPSPDSPKEDPAQTPTESDAELYQRACALLDENKLEEAYAIFLTIEDYADVSVYLSRFFYQYSTKAEFENVSGKKLKNVYAVEYNEYGQPTYEMTFYVQSQSLYTYQYWYDAKYNLTTYTVTTEDGAYTTYYRYNDANQPVWRGSPEGGTTLEYDALGNLIKRIDSYNYVEEFEYNALGQLLETTCIDDTGKVYLRETYAYNEKGQKISQTVVSLFGERVYSFTYDATGNLTCKSVVQDNGHSYRYEYEYDERGNLTKQTEYAAGILGGSSIYTYEYDEANELIHETHGYGDGSIVFERTRTLRTVGNSIKEVWTTRYDHHSDAYSYSQTYESIYEYDANGNLIRVTYTDSIVEYGGWQLYYNPNPSISRGKLDAYIGK